MGTGEVVPLQPPLGIFSNAFFSCSTMHFTVLCYDVDTNCNGEEHQCRQDPMKTGSPMSTQEAQ
jgi:hypothetical protein